MKVTSERLPKSLIALDIEPDAKLVEQEMNKAAKRVASKVAIPGFRPGKAPRFIIENYYGKGIIEEEALDHIIQSAYKAALEQEQIEPIAQASIESVEQEPLRFRIVVPVEPTVTVGDYRAIREEYNEETITDEIVADAMDQLRERHVVLQELEEERAAEEGDQLAVTMESFVDGRPLAELEAEAQDEDDDDDEDYEDEDDEDDDDEDDDDEDEDEDEDEDDDDEDEDEESASHAEDATLVLEEKRLVPELYRGLLGAKPGEEREIEAEMPEDHSNALIAGKTVTFKVVVNEIKQRILPEWDELPGLEDFEGDLESLRAKTRERLEKNVRDHATRELLDRFIAKVVADTEYDIPDAMVEERAHSLLHEQVEQLARYGISMEQYLQITGKSHDEATKEFMPQAENSLRSSLALQQIVRQEGLRVDIEEIDAEIETLLEDYPAEQRDMVRGRLSGDLRNTVAASVLDKKLRERIVAIATGKAPGLPAADAE